MSLSDLNPLNIVNPEVTIDDLRLFLAGKASYFAFQQINSAMDRITLAMGSTLLRKFRDAYRDKKGNIFTDDQLSSIRNEINFINGKIVNKQGSTYSDVYSKKSVPIKAGAGTSTIQVTRSIGASSVTTNMGYASWFKVAPLAGNYRISSEMQKNRKLRNRAPRDHNGIDLATFRGDKVFAVGDGKVTRAGTEAGGGGYGKRVYVDHGNGYETIYAHLDRIDVKEGSTIKAGTVVGLLGNTGDSDGPHLHLGIRYQGKTWINPKQYLNALKQTKVAATVQAMDGGNQFKLNSNTQDWLSRVLSEVQKRGSADVKAAIKTKDDVFNILWVEGGINRDDNAKINVSVVNNINFSGPFQVGGMAWRDAIQQFSDIKLSGTDEIAHRKILAAYTRNFTKGGPGDLDVMAPGIVAYWNNLFKYFYAEAKKAGILDKVQQLPKDYALLHFLAGAGAKGFIDKIRTNSPLVGPKESKEFQALGRKRLAEYRSILNA